MPDITDFELVQKQQIPEFNAVCKLFKHKKTSATVFSLKNSDVNKTIGIALRTPPENSTGIQHILEHMVFCGSRKYPVKDVFVELLKGSLQNYLNAYTYLDTTCYLASTPNKKDYSNCMELMLDAVFFPTLSPENFALEGWRLESNGRPDKLVYKGIVYSEMKGHFSSASSRITENIRKSLFPQSPYSNTPGGLPEQIPYLRYEDLLKYHKKHYHPSNSFIFLYGDIEPDNYLERINSFLKDFDTVDYAISVQRQQPFIKPARAEYTFPSRQNEGNRDENIVTLNWVLNDKPDFKTTLVNMMFETILMGLNSSPLRIALLESVYGHTTAGVGLFQDLRQPYFSTGLKGVAQADLAKAESSVLNALERIVSRGIDRKLKKAALNRLQFLIRENNFGKTPAGIQLMLRALSAWCYEKDIFDKIGFEQPLQEIEQLVKNDDNYFERLIEKCLLNNNHRSVAVFRPDPGLLDRESGLERSQLERIRESLTPEQLDDIYKSPARLDDSIRLRKAGFDRNMIPRLRVSDIEMAPDIINQDIVNLNGLRVLFNDIHTSGTAYITLGFDLRALPVEFVRYSRLIARAMLQLGGDNLNETINNETGGVRTGFFNISNKDKSTSSSLVLFPGKAILNNTGALIDSFKKLILDSDIHNPSELYDITSDELRRHESMLYSEHGFKFIRYRLNAHFNEAGRMSECLTGIDYIRFLKNLLNEFEKTPERTIAIFDRIKQILINRKTMIVNVTCSRPVWDNIRDQLLSLSYQLPENEPVYHPHEFDPLPETEGFVIPSQTGIAGKGIDIGRSGFESKGAAYVVSNHLWTTWFWDKIRVTGGAYESYCDYDHTSDVFTIVSNRDLNLTKTIEAINSAGEYLSSFEISRDELTSCIIGAVRKFQSYKSPDARGHQALAHYLAGIDSADRTAVFEQILHTKASDFTKFADVMKSLAVSDVLKILGPAELIDEVKSINVKPMEKISMV